MTLADGTVSARLKPGLEPAPGPAEPLMSPLMTNFIDAVNATGGAVLDLGGRFPNTAPSNFGNLFHAPARLLTNEIDPDAGLGTAEDGHALVRAFAASSVDGVFSVSVMEHVAAPWVLAAEVNRVLKPGGLTLHYVPQSWPLHEQPHDFWRMTDAGLSVLYGPETGFEVLATELNGPIGMMMPGSMRYGPYLETPFVPGYADAAILARKVAEIPSSAGAWPRWAPM